MTELKKSADDFVAEAKENITLIQPADAIDRLDDGNVVFVDVRDSMELAAEGKIPGAVHAPRGDIEFFADPESEYHMDVFSSGKELIFYCAAGPGSALAAYRLQEMGLENVGAIDGGFAAWKEASGPVEEVMSGATTSNAYINPEQD